MASKQSLIYHLTSERKRFLFRPERVVEIDNELDALKERINQVTTELTCPICYRPFDNKYTARRHIARCTSLEKKKKKKLADTSTIVEIDTDETAQSSTDTRAPGVPVSVINNMTNTKTVNEMNRVKVLLSEDYMPILMEKLGSKQAVYEYLKSCMYRKQAGDLDIFNKIYLEGRSPNYYPVKCLDRKALRFAFVDKDGLVVEGGDFVFGHISGNIQDCYIQIQNEAIGNHLLKNKTQSQAVTKNNGNNNNGCGTTAPDNSPIKDDNGDFLFNQHDVGGWQDHLVEYMDVKYKHKLMKGLGDMLYEKVDDYDGPYMNIGLNFRYQPDELEFASPKGFTKEQEAHLLAMATTKGAKTI